MRRHLFYHLIWSVFQSSYITHITSYNSLRTYVSSFPCTALYTCSLTCGCSYCCVSLLWRRNSWVCKWHFQLSTSTKKKNPKKAGPSVEINVFWLKKVLTRFSIHESMFVFWQIQIRLEIRIPVTNILGFQYWASTHLRYQWFGNCLDNKPWIGTPIWWSFQEMH